MARYEFEVVNLKAQHDEHDRRHFRWQCRRESRCVNHDELECLLNDMGRDGWSVVAFDTDAAFGSNLVLQRALSEGGSEDAATPEPKARRRPQPTSEAPGAPDPGMMALIAEVQALRAQLASQPVPQVTVQPTPVQVTAPTMNVETLLQPLIEQLRVVRRAQDRPATSVLSAEALDRLGATLERSIVQAIAAALEPRLMPIEPEPVPDTTPWYRRGFTWAFGR